MPDIGKNYRCIPKLDGMTAHSIHLRSQCYGVMESPGLLSHSVVAGIVLVPFVLFVLFSERELTFTFAICYRPSVCRLSVVCLSVTFVRPTQAVEIVGNISTALGTLAIRGHPLKILQRSSQGNPSAGGVKDKRGSQI